MKTKIFKTLPLTMLLSVVLLSISNCDKVAEALNIESPFSTHFIINVTENDELLFMSSEEIDLSSNQDFQNNKDKIEYFTLNEVYYKIENYEGTPGILGSGSISFSDDTGQLGDAIFQTNIDFYSLFESGAETTLPITEETKSAIQDALKNDMKVIVSIEGLVSDKPVYVDLEVFLVIGAKVNP
jgi:hypothetical protein